MYPRYRRRRTTYRRRPLLRRTGARTFNRAMARTAQRVINNNLEKKYQDLAYNINVDNTGSSIQDLTSINAGMADSSQRIGDKIRLLSLKFRLQLSAADSTNYFRIILFQWHPDNANTTPIVTSILQNATYSSYYNHDEGSQFSVFYDKQYALDTQGNATRVLDWTFRFNSKSPKMKWIKKNVKYNGSTLQGSDHLYYLFISDSGTTPNPNISGSSRLVYTDA